MRRCTPPAFGTVVSLLLCLLFTALQTSSVVSAATFVYVANEGGDIATLQLDPQNGDLKLLGKTQSGPLTMHLAVSPDKKFLYASVRQAPFQLVSFAINPQTGALTEKGRIASPANMTYISTDRSGKFLFGADYPNGRVAVLAIGSDGLLSEKPVQVFETSLNAHSILPSPNNKFVFVPHLGSARISAFKFDEQTGKLTFNGTPFYYVKQTSGPRHQAYHPNGKWWYLTSELDGLVYVHTFDEQTGIINEIQMIRALPDNSALPNSPSPGGAAPSTTAPANGIRQADIHITPNGRFLYTSERTSSTIAAFSIDQETGRLKYIANYPTEPTPRGFNIDPSGKYLIAAGEVKEGYVRVHAINPQSGALTDLKRYSVGDRPNWVMCVEFD
jgi:6-phosphogluconolactonase